MRVLWLFCLFALVLPVTTGEETVPEGFQQWTAESLKQMDQALKTEAASNPHHIADAAPLGFLQRHVHALSP